MIPQRSLAHLDQRVRASLRQRAGRLVAVLRIGWHQRVERGGDDGGGFGVDEAVDASTTHDGGHVEVAAFPVVLALRLGEDVVGEFGPTPRDLDEVVGSDALRGADECVFVLPREVFAVVGDLRDGLDVFDLHVTGGQRLRGAFVAAQVPCRAHQPRRRRAGHRTVRDQPGLRAGRRVERPRLVTVPRSRTAQHCGVQPLELFGHGGQVIGQGAFAVRVPVLAQQTGHTGRYLVEEIGYEHVFDLRTNRTRTASPILERMPRSACVSRRARGPIRRAAPRSRR